MDKKKLYSVYVGNLSTRIQKNDLQALFEKYGLIADIYIAGTGRVNYGFVRYYELSSVKKAIEKLDGIRYRGYRILVQYENDTRRKLQRGCDSEVFSDHPNNQKNSSENTAYEYHYNRSDRMIYRPPNYPVAVKSTETQNYPVLVNSTEPPNYLLSVNSTGPPNYPLSVNSTGPPDYPVSLNSTEHPNYPMSVHNPGPSNYPMSVYGIGPPNYPPPVNGPPWLNIRHQLKSPNANTFNTLGISTAVIGHPESISQSFNALNLATDQHPVVSYDLNLPLPRNIPFINRQIEENTMTFVNMAKETYTGHHCEIQSEGISQGKEAKKDFSDVDFSQQEVLKKMPFKSSMNYQIPLDQIKDEDLRSVQNKPIDKSNNDGWFAYTLDEISLNKKDKIDLKPSCQVSEGTLDHSKPSHHFNADSSTQVHIMGTCDKDATIKHSLLVKNVGEIPLPIQDKSSDMCSLPVQDKNLDMCSDTGRDVSVDSKMKTVMNFQSGCENINIIGITFPPPPPPPLPNVEPPALPPLPETTPPPLPPHGILQDVKSQGSSFNQDTIDKKESKHANCSSKTELANYHYNMFLNPRSTNEDNKDIEHAIQSHNSDKRGENMDNNKFNETSCRSPFCEFWKKKVRAARDGEEDKLPSSFQEYCQTAGIKINKDKRTNKRYPASSNKTKLPKWKLLGKKELNTDIIRVINAKLERTRERLKQLIDKSTVSETDSGITAKHSSVDLKLLKKLNDKSKVLETDSGIGVKNASFDSKLQVSGKQLNANNYIDLTEDNSRNEPIRKVAKYNSGSSSGKATGMLLNNTCVFSKKEPSCSVSNSKLPQENKSEKKLKDSETDYIQIDKEHSTSLKPHGESGNKCEAKRRKLNTSLEQRNDVLQEEAVQNGFSKTEKSACQVPKNVSAENDTDIRQAVITAKRWLSYRADAFKKIQDSYVPHAVAKPPKVKRVCETEKKSNEKRNMPTQKDSNSSPSILKTCKETLSPVMKTKTSTSVNPYTSYMDMPTTPIIPIDSSYSTEFEWQSWRTGPDIFSLEYLKSLGNFRTDFGIVECMKQKDELKTTFLSDLSDKGSGHSLLKTSEMHEIDLDKTPRLLIDEAVSDDNNVQVGEVDSLRLKEKMNNPSPEKSNNTDQNPDTNEQPGCDKSVFYKNNGNTADDITECYFLNPENTESENFYSKSENTVNNAMHSQNSKQENITNLPSCVSTPGKKEETRQHLSDVNGTSKSQSLAKNDRPVFNPCFKRILRLPVDSLYKTEFIDPIMNTSSCGNLYETLIDEDKCNVDTYNEDLLCKQISACESRLEKIKSNSISSNFKNASCQTANELLYSFVPECCRDHAFKLCNEAFTKNRENDLSSDEQDFRNRFEAVTSRDYGEDPIGIEKDLTLEIQSEGPRGRVKDVTSEKQSKDPRSRVNDVISEEQNEYPRIKDVTSKKQSEDAISIGSVTLVVPIEDPRDRVKDVTSEEQSEDTNSIEKSVASEEQRGDLRIIDVTSKEQSEDSKSREEGVTLMLHREDHIGRVKDGASEKQSKDPRSGVNDVISEEQNEYPSIIDVTSKEQSEDTKSRGGVTLMVHPRGRVKDMTSENQSRDPRSRVNDVISEDQNEDLRIVNVTSKSDVKNVPSVVQSEDLRIIDMTSKEQSEGSKSREEGVSLVVQREDPRDRVEDVTSEKQSEDTRSTERSVPSVEQSEDLQIRERDVTYGQNGEKGMPTMPTLFPTSYEFIQQQDELTADSLEENMKQSNKRSPPILSPIFSEKQSTLEHDNEQASLNSDDIGDFCMNMCSRSDSEYSHQNQYQEESKTSTENDVSKIESMHLDQDSKETMYRFGGEKYCSGHAGKQAVISGTKEKIREWDSYIRPNRSNSVTLSELSKSKTNASKNKVRRMERHLFQSAEKFLTEEFDQTRKRKCRMRLSYTGDKKESPK